MTKISSGVSPLVDVGVPFACKNLSQTELVRPVIFLVRLVPWRPKNQWQRTVPPNDIEIVHGKILLSPITRRSDDSLMFAHHLLEVLDCFQRYIVLFIAKVHESSGVSAMLGNHDLDRAIWIDLRNRDVFAASTGCQSHCNCCNSCPRKRIDTHPISKVLCKGLCV